MPREIRLNAFDMNCVVHQSPGLWRHPRDRSRDYNRLQPWVELARTLERGLFDGLFLADVLGLYDVYGASPDSALAHATQVPNNDPMLLVPAMAAVTEHLGFGVTVTLSYEPPLPFARRMSTLDHLTDGRIGWNIVTGYLDSAAKGMGQTGQRRHDDRYAVAEDYMQVVYKLWEGSWADDAVVADKARGVFTDPTRVRKVTHEGSHHRLDAIHLSEPSPQRTPVLYQAGTSPAGLGFAGRHAECVFMSGPSKAVIGPRVAAVRQAAVAAGRTPEDVTIFAMMTVIVAETDAAAQALLADYRAYADPQGALTLMSGWTGIDFSRLDPDAVVEHVENDAGRSALENITRADPDRRWTVREVAEHVCIGGIGPLLVGSPLTVADGLEAWIDDTRLDGFNLTFAVRPETFETVVDLLVPELQRRGRYKRAYAPGTLREKLFGRSRLAPTHCGHAFRFP
ncbi:LLM class flavin-dependent oxidoreductase [Lichenihabitans sp. Uapishka_5]|uniref:LLM class flavin-dependent oxidoreductase n=1 Tax=Lichenihabitans sp. Uapishka_5 TaxID=3037302 RepID=UPI0029E8273C|nr:LLM class flavin-dependent oxidoreductase [Lichenihabitans sp. Uapishka_5]MDX7952612.1 LLM class flavin-dependent oxidoreductase [Lichenihabitans sp. Uapishka_5]